MIIDIPGGTAEVRDGPTVDGRSVLQALSSEYRVCMYEDEDRAKAHALEPDKVLPLEEAGDAEGTRKVFRRTGFASSIAWNRVLDGLVVIGLRSWTLPDPLPTLDTLGQIEPGPAQDAFYIIRKALTPLYGDWVKDPDFSTDASIIAVDGKPKLDLDSPTAASSASNGGGSAPTTLATSRTRATPVPSESSSSASSSPEPATLTT